MKVEDCAPVRQRHMREAMTNTKRNTETTTIAMTREHRWGEEGGRRSEGGGLCTCEPETHHYDYETESRRTMPASFHENPAVIPSFSKLVFSAYLPNLALS